MTSVKGQNVTVNGTYLPLNTKGADEAFSTLSGPIPAAMTITVTGITTSQVGTSANDYVAITTTPANGIPVQTFVDGVLVASPVTVAGGSTHSYVVKLVDPGNIVVATSAPVTATAKVFIPPVVTTAYWMSMSWQLGPPGPWPFTGGEADVISFTSSTGTYPSTWTLSFTFPGDRLSSCLLWGRYLPASWPASPAPMSP